MSALRVTEDWREIREAAVVSLLAHLAVAAGIGLLGMIPLPERWGEAGEYERPVEITVLDASVVAGTEEGLTEARRTTARFVQLPEGEEIQEEVRLAQETAEEGVFEAAREMRAGSERVEAGGDAALPSLKGRESEVLELGGSLRRREGQQTARERAGTVTQLPALEEVLAEAAASLSAERREGQSEGDLRVAEPEEAGDSTETRPESREEGAAAARSKAQEARTEIERAAGKFAAEGLLGEAAGSRIEGALDAAGPAGLEAVVTASAVYKQRVVDLISARWRGAVERRIGILQPGTVRVRFKVDAAGRISDLRVVGNTSNPLAGMITLRAVSESELPPMPAAVVASLPDGRMDIDFFFSINE